MQESQKLQEATKDLQSIKLRDIIIEALEDAKGVDIALIDVAHLTEMTDYMIIVSGTSNRHIQTLAESAYKKAQEQGFDKSGVEGLGKSEWVVVDFSDVVLHVMSPTARAHYNIEGLWEIATEK